MIRYVAFKVTNMVLGDVPGLLGIPFGDILQDFLVFLCQLMDAIEVGDIGDPKALHLIPQSIDHLQQPFVSGGLIDDLMEGGVLLDKPLNILVLSMKRCV